MRIGVDPKRHTIDTTGKVKVVLTAGGVNIRLWHDALHIEVPDDGPGSTLVDLKDYTGQLTPLVQGFPIDGDVDAGDGGPEDYAFRLEGKLSAAFGAPVTITAKVNGFLYTLPIADGTLVYKLPTACRSPAPRISTSATYSRSRDR